MTWWIVYKKELKSFFTGSFGYIALAISLFISGYFFINLLSAFRIQVAQAASLPVASLGNSLNLNQGLFGPYLQTLSLLSIFLLPLLSARCLTEESTYGTRDLLKLTGASAFSIISGKYLACLSFALLLLFLGALYPLWIAFLGNAEFPVLLSGLFGLTLFSASLLALAFAVASHSKTVSSASLAGILVVFLWYLIHVPAESLGSQGALLLESLSPKLALAEMITGEISLSGITLFGSVILLSLVYTGITAFPAVEAPPQMEKDLAA